MKKLTPLPLPKYIKRNASRITHHALRITMDIYYLLIKMTSHFKIHRKRMALTLAGRQRKHFLWLVAHSPTSSTGVTKTESTTAPDLVTSIYRKCGFISTANLYSLHIFLTRLLTVQIFFFQILVFLLSPGNTAGLAGLMVLCPP